MTATDPIDAARLGLLLGDLRLPAIKHIWSRFAERADKEGWPAARFLAALAEHEIAERGHEPLLGAASSAISPRRTCRPARPSTASTATPCP